MTSKPGWFLFDGVVKVDLETGAEERYAFGDGVFGSETPMAPRPGATAEDDGYLVTFTTDMVNDRSECLVLRRGRHHRRPDRARPPARTHLAAAPTPAGPPPPTSRGVVQPPYWWSERRIGGDCGDGGDGPA